MPAAFDDIAARFWDPHVPYGVQAPLTDEALAEAEGALGHRLPEDLVRLLRIQNGGQVQHGLRAHPSPGWTSWAASWVPFEECFGIGPGGLLDTPQLLREWDLPDGLVLLSGDGHWWIALDHRGAGAEDEVPVVYVDTEASQIRPLAASFTQFVEGLMPPPDDDRRPRRWFRRRLLRRG